MSPQNSHYLRYIEALKYSSIFKNLDTQEILSILDHMSRVKWEKGVFKNTTEFNTSLHFIVSGRIKAYQINPTTNREHTLFILKGGDVFDVLSLMDAEVHVLYWETLDDMELLTIPTDELWHVIDEHPKINHCILHYLGSRMLILEEASTDMCLHNTLTRLSNLLLRYSNNKSHKLEVINNLPNNEIANLIGTTRAVVNRNIQELKKAGAISVKRKHIDIENIDILLAMVEEQ